MNIKLELSIDQLNLIMASLSKMPYEVVYSLIPIITEQAQKQIKNETKTVGPPQN